MSVPDEFIADALAVDDLRLSSGDEWGERPLVGETKRWIFARPDSRQGLAVFVACCWMDTQADYKTTWSTYLGQADDWLHRRAPMPREAYAGHNLRQLERVIRRPDGLAGWFADTILSTADDVRSTRPTFGLYRFAGVVCQDLFGVTGSNLRAVERLRSGEMTNTATGGNYKRPWMLIRWLRRDNSVVRCLFERALRTRPNGQAALRVWYDDTVFDPLECELPVDGRVETRWNDIFRTHLDRPKVAVAARKLAHDHHISPSALDTILFFPKTEDECASR